MTGNALNSSMLNGARAVAYSITSSLDQASGNLSRLKFVEGSDLADIVTTAVMEIADARVSIAKAITMLVEMEPSQFADIHRADGI